MLNKTMLIGHVGASDAQLRVTGAGAAVANFSFAVNDYYKDKAGEYQSRTTWFAVSAWGSKAKTVAERVTKGRLLYLEGTVFINRWTGDDGLEHADLSLKLARLRFLDKKDSQNAEPEIDASGEDADNGIQPRYL